LHADHDSGDAKFYPFFYGLIRAFLPICLLCKMMIYGECDFIPYFSDGSIRACCQPVCLLMDDDFIPFFYGSIRAFCRPICLQMKSPKRKTKLEQKSI
jgi:hypothetical protein